MAKDLKIAAAYIRVSTEDQAEYSPDAQLVEIRKFASREGFLIPEEFIFMDEGITGRKTDKRDSFNRMIGTAKMRPKPFEAILLWKFSRFARNREDSIVYKSMLRKQLGIEVISVSEPVGDEKMSILIEALIEAMDEYYSINLAEEVKRGMTEKARRGGLQSIPSFGYRLDGGKLAPDPEEADYVRDIFARFIAGEGLLPIAKGLNQMGVRTHRGNRFENRTIEYILRNPVYIGKLRWNPAGKTRRDFANKNIILADAEHEPILDMETWEKAQQRMAEVKARWKYKARPVSELKDWTSGIVRCAACNATLVFSKPHFYKCNNYAKGACGTSQHVKADLISEAIMERLEQDLSSALELPYTIIRSADRGGDEIARLRSALDGIDKKMLRLREAFLAGADTVEEYQNDKQKLTESAAELQDRIEQLENAAAAEDRAAMLKAAISESLLTLRSPIATLEEKHNAADQIIESCTWNKAKNLLQITYRLIV